MMMHAFHYGEATMTSLTDLLDSGFASKGKELHLLKNIASCFSHIKGIFFDGNSYNAGDGNESSNVEFDVPSSEHSKEEKNSQLLVADQTSYLNNDSDCEERYHDDGNPQRRSLNAYEWSKSLGNTNEQLLIDEAIKIGEGRRETVAATGSYPISNMLLEKGLRDVAPYDCSQYIEEFCLKLVRIVTKICKLKKTSGVTFGIDINIVKSNMKYKPWVSLIYSEKVLLNSILNFLAVVGSGSRESAENWDNILGGIVAEYWEESEGIIVLK
jgi:hypothetical protein